MNESRFTNRPTPILVHFLDGKTQLMEWPHNLCTHEATTSRSAAPVGNLRVKLRNIDPDGTFNYDEIPGTFTKLEDMLEKS